MDSDYPNPDDSGTPAMPDKPDMDEPKDEKMEGETTLVPSSLFGGKTPQPGQTCTFKVVHCYEDECEVQYVSSNEDKSESGDDKMNPMEERMMPYADK